jgi:hypothetical protein
MQETREKLKKGLVMREALKRKAEQNALAKRTLWKRIGAGVAAVLTAVGLGFGIKAVAGRK